MRRSGLHTALRLRGLLLSQGCPPAAAALSGLSAAAAAGGWRTSSAAAASAAAGWRPLSTAAEAAQAPAAAPQQQPGEPPAEQGASARGRRYPPVDPDSALGRLVRCTSVPQMRTWRQELLAAGAFGAPELGAAIRALAQQGSGDRSERQAYLRELLEAATAAGAPALDGKAAAYLVWGPAKLGLPPSDPAVVAAAEAALQHVPDMQVSRAGWRCSSLCVCV